MNPEVLMAETEPAKSLKSMWMIWIPLFSSLFSFARDELSVMMYLGFVGRLASFSTSTLL